VNSNVLLSKHIAHPLVGGNFDNIKMQGTAMKKNIYMQGFPTIILYTFPVASPSPHTKGLNR
jgi:hypothetical protein